jgi:hypothetical protein
MPLYVAKLEQSPDFRSCSSSRAVAKGSFADEPWPGSRHSAHACSRTASVSFSCSALRRRASDKTQARSNSRS